MINQKMDKEQMKRGNRQLIFTQIHCSGAVSRTQLANLTGLTPMTVGRIADDLIQQGLVVEEEQKETGKSVGRRPRMLQVASDNMLSLGMELDRDRLRVGVMDFNGTVICKREWNQNLFNQPPEKVAELAAKLLAELLEEFHKRESGVNLRNCHICGVVCPGIIDSKKGVVCFSSQLQWHNVPLADLLKKATGIQHFAIDNEVKARGQAEVLFGLAQNQKSVVLLNFGSGVGSSLLVDRKLYRGRGNMAGEIGHVCIDPNGGLCECGRRGCLQTYLSDLAILQDARKFNAESTLDSLFEAFNQGEIWAVNIINHTVRYAIIAVGMLANLYAPDMMILCGRLIESYPELQRAIDEDYRLQLGDHVKNGMVLATSRLGEDGNLIGAATLAFCRELDMNV